MNTCTRCPAPARWRDADGRTFCGSHVPANGKPVTRIPAAEIDIVDRLEEGWMEGKALDFHMEAAAEIRRLRALVDAG
jgi:hypothetical protein